MTVDISAHSNTPLVHLFKNDKPTNIKEISHSFIDLSHAIFIYADLHRRSIMGVPNPSRHHQQFQFAMRNAFPYLFILSFLSKFLFLFLFFFFFLYYKVLGNSRHRPVCLIMHIIMLDSSFDNRFRANATEEGSRASQIDTKQTKRHNKTYAPTLSVVVVCVLKNEQHAVAILAPRPLEPNPLAGEIDQPALSTEKK